MQLFGKARALFEVLENDDDDNVNRVRTRVQMHNPPIDRIN